MKRRADDISDSLPLPARRRLPPGCSLAELRPDLAALWHPTRNGALLPSEVTVASNEKVWWICLMTCASGCSHEYEQGIGNKSRGGNGCPFCSVPAKKFCEHKSLTGQRPDLANQWHPTRNGTMLPSEVAVASQRKVWWLCRETCASGCPHEYEQTVANKSRGGQGCPFCAGQRICEHTSLAGQRPDLADEWHPARNGALRPSDVAVSSNQKVWWLCPATCAHGCRHEYEQTINSKSRGRGCPFCARQRVCKHDSLAGQRPDLADEWHPTRNGALLPSEVAAGSSQKVWWLCPVTCAHGCRHEYEQIIHSKSGKDCGCPFCSGRIVCEHTSLAGQRPELADEWHPTRNGALRPSDVAVSSNQKVWWLCPATCAHGCRHEYEQVINSKSSGCGCPFCAGFKVCEHASLAGQRPDLADQWHPTLNGALLSSEVTISSGQKVWWLCPATCAHGCRHEYEQVINNKSKGIGCPFCSGHRVCEHDSLAGQRPDLAAQWHPTLNGALLSSEVTVASGRKVWWRCVSCDLDYRQVVASKSHGSGCPGCRPVGYSRIAIDWLEYRAAQDQCVIQHALNGDEFRFDPDSRSKADGYCSATNTVYEFHGDFWHGHPDSFDPDAINSVSKKTFGALYAATLEREARIRALGYNLVVIWESDWREQRRLQGAPEDE